MEKQKEKPKLDKLHWILLIFLSIVLTAGFTLFAVDFLDKISTILINLVGVFAVAMLVGFLYKFWMDHYG